MKLTHASGYDEILIKVLKICKHFIISPLTYIINRSLATGIFPDRLKFSEIKPNLKMVIEVLPVISDLYHC
jgi:hypothetical protein